MYHNVSHYSRLLRTGSEECHNIRNPIRPKIGQFSSIISRLESQSEKFRSKNDASSCGCSRYDNVKRVECGGGEIRPLITRAARADWGPSCQQLLCCSGAKPTHSITFCKHFINTVSTSLSSRLKCPSYDFIKDLSAYDCIFYFILSVSNLSCNTTSDLSTLNINLNIQYSSLMTKIQHTQKLQMVLPWSFLGMLPKKYYFWTCTMVGQ